MVEPQYDAEDMDRYYDMVEFRAMRKQRDELLAALKLAESVYRQNCVAVGEPSSVLAAMQSAISKAEES